MKSDVNRSSHQCSRSDFFGRTCTQRSVQCDFSIFIDHTGAPDFQQVRYKIILPKYFLKKKKYINNVCTQLPLNKFSAVYSHFHNS